MSKGTIISVLILALALGAFGAVYKLYFQPKLEAYKLDEQLEASLQIAYDELVQSFDGRDPELLVRAWREEIQPWRDAFAQRTTFFNWGGWGTHEPIPQEGPILRFWYEEQTNKVLMALYEKVGETLGNYALFPNDIRVDLGVLTADNLHGDATEQDIMQELIKLSYGVSMCELLLDAKATSIQHVYLWPVRQDPAHNEMIRLRTMGLAFTISARDLVSFIEEQFRLANRFFNIDGIRITYPYIAYNTEPQLQVEMLVTQGNFVKRASGTPAAPTQVAAAPRAPGAAAADVYAASGIPDAPEGFGSRRAQQEEVKEPGVFGRAWKWFKRHYLYMN